MKFYHIVTSMQQLKERGDYKLFKEAAIDHGLEYVALDNTMYEMSSNGPVGDTFVLEEGSILFRSSTGLKARALWGYIKYSNKFITLTAQPHSYQGFLKFGSGSIWSQSGISTPSTFFLTEKSEEAAKKAFSYFGNPKCLVAKPNQGMHGTGVELVYSYSDLWGILDKEPFPAKGYLVQEYVETSKGRDIRAIVLGDKVLAAVQRINDTGDFRSNIAQGGYAIEHQMTKEESDIAVKAVKALGLEYGGVDIMFGENGPVITEVNSPCGLESIHPATGISVPHHIVEYLLEKHKKQQANKQ